MMWDFPKKWLGLVAIIGTLLFLVFWKTNQSVERTPITMNVQEKEIEKKGKPKISDTKEQKRTIIIDVKGAVNKEGVYEMKEGDRVKDAVQKAGGFLSEVDIKKVNLAQIVQDQMLLYIPSKNESEQGMFTSSKEDGKIRINTAAKEQLEKITGIGSRKAESILKYREEHGPFQKIEDLLEIDGIGAKSLEKIKDQIIIP
ncbi:helix-hairpin-helix domain-containing protein [Bacillus thuringiensis]|uniref:Competence protein ComE n=8 Tax=Bacillus cereus group TaxID=86661 RepID=A0A9X6SKJ8_BACTU|nr:MULTISPECIES: helix-hairpin-helix domain-containing protein [Bacillus]EAO51684.1 COME operon protein 1 [Bacillus thuringiensis serovar israelensis ATCC 35646]EEM39851.1 Competence protein ComEA helix-hairpin-helix repeat protein [Bacillus thuringiensis serovar sotto str. T04001]MED1155454.1 helix-hairpin-helix domain-containing protein [Bacillus paranthracis]AJH08205.1 competence ComEA helix-hairpin-helix repeat region domain protein [Bacillus thuringiensis HD1002]AND09640.1 competence prot